MPTIEQASPQVQCDKNTERSAQKAQCHTEPLTRSAWFPKGRSPGSRRAGHSCRTYRLPRSEDPVALGTTSAYRCGGSTGIASTCVTGFPFHLEAVSLQQGTVRKIRGVRPRSARILTPNPNLLKNSHLTQIELTLRPERPIVRAMDSNLSLLDQKLSQLIALLDKSREQNAQLRARLETAQARTHELETQINTARNKLEQVVARLPESVNLS